MSFQEALPARGGLCNSGRAQGFRRTSQAAKYNLYKFKEDGIVLEFCNSDNPVGHTVRMVHSPVRKRLPNAPGQLDDLYGQPRLREESSSKITALVFCFGGNYIMAPVSFHFMIPGD